MQDLWRKLYRILLLEPISIYNWSVQKRTMYSDGLFVHEWLILLCVFSCIVNIIIFLSGSIVEPEILRLVTTALVALSIWKLICPEKFPTDMTNFTTMADEYYSHIRQLLISEQLSPTTRGKLHTVADRVVEYINSVDKKFPMVYSSLELGSSWMEVCLKLLELYKERDLHTKYVFGMLDTVVPNAAEVCWSKTFEICIWYPHL